MTTNRRVADVVLAYDVDQSSANAAATSTQRLSRELDLLAAQQTDLTRAFSRGQLDATTLADKLAMVESEARRTTSALNALGQPREIDVRTQRFDDVSRDVGLAGDVQSNLGAVGGLAGSVGLGGVGGGIAAGGELVALIEELPRLKAAAQGLPATIQTAGAALGTSGAGLIGSIGALGVAAAAVAVAAARAARQIKDASEDFNQFIDARVETEKLIALGETTTAQAQELAQAREAEAQAVRKVQAELQRQQDGLRGFARALNQIANLLPGIQGVNDKIRELDSEADGLEREAGQLNQAIEAGRFSAADRAEAEKKAAEQQRQAAQEQEQAATKRQSAIDSLLGSETKTRDNINLLNSALSSGELTAQQRAAAESKLSKLMQQTAASADEAGEALSRFDVRSNNLDRDSYGSTTIGGGGSSRRSRSTPPPREVAQPRERAAENIQERIADVEMKAGQQRVDAATQFNNDIAKIETTNRRRLADIRRDAARDERDAARGRNFAGIIDIRERTSEQIADANLSAQREAADRRTALDQRLAELNRANNRELAQLRSKVQAEGQILRQGYNNALGAARGFVNGLQREFERGQASGVQQAVRAELGAIAREQ